MANDRDRASKADVQSTELNKLPTEEQMDRTEISSGVEAETEADVFRGNTTTRSE